MLEDTIPPKHIVLIFDGGSRGNPGPAYGSYRLELPGLPPIDRSIEFEEPLTNNQAEYRTLLAALETLLELLEQQGAPTHGMILEIQTDSELVAQQLRGTYKVRNPKLQQLYDRVRALLARFDHWQVHWQPREVIYQYFGH
ncbi:MAG: ribonuclease HI family protein [Thermomicrobium sp.]